MNKKVKTTKFKVINAKINKKLVGDEFDLQKIKPKGGHGDGGNKPPKSRQAPTWFVEFEKRNDQRFNKLEKEVLNSRHDVSSFSTRIDNLVKVNNLRE